MPEPFIKYLRIENYKSIDKLELHDLPPFAVFAGANGSGKSNYFDAMEFVSHIARFGVDEAMRLHGDYERMHSFLRKDEEATTFAFEMAIDFEKRGSRMIREDKDNYSGGYGRFAMTVHSWHTSPLLEEEYWGGENVSWHSRYGNIATLQMGRLPERELTVSFLQYLHSDLTHTLKQLRTFYIDSINLERSAGISNNSNELGRNGYNVASVLERLEQDEEIREIILDMLSLCVPSIESIRVVKNRLNMSSDLYFKQEGIEQEFPIGMVSDGTVALLCILVAVLDTKKRAGLTMIEEPERGLHPEAISQIIAFMRERATPRNPIWLTTHSEAVVRATQEGDLYFVEKQDGRTVIKPALPYTNGSFTRDRAWLSNALGGGLPW
jgi:predicted ATPase